MLATTKHVAHNTTNYYATYDGNGNVSEYLDDTGSITAHYEYDPFGRTIVTTGPLADEFAYQFSTKPIDATTGLHYYGYRWYDAGAGRWINRDPLGESGFYGNKYFAFTKEDLQYIASLDSEGENLDVLENAQNNIFYAAGKTAYVMVNNEPVDKTDLYGLVCNTFVNRTKAIISSVINAGHEWIVYDGNSVGFWPNRGYVVLRPDLADRDRVPIYWQWRTEQKKSGKIKWGSGAGKSCACATCADILSSLASSPNPGWRSFQIRNNCRRFAAWALDGSCLKKGKKTSFNP